MTGAGLLRYAVLLSSAVALSACTTVSDPKLSASDVVQPAQAGGAQVAQATATADAAAHGDNAETPPLLALVATGDEAANAVTDPALPEAVPLPMFRQTVTEALIATATPSLPAATYNEPGIVTYKGVTKSGTANHLVEARAEIAADAKPELHNLIGQYATAYKVPERLVHRVVQRESGYNPAARNGPYFGLMQISHATARGMGYNGSAQGLLNANTNLRYAVKYLAGAYKVAEGNETQAVKLYARGFYYDAKRKGLLEEAGLRKGPNSLQTVFIDPQAATSAPVVAQKMPASGDMVAQSDSNVDPMTTQSVVQKNGAAKSVRAQFKPREMTQR